jgi:hypothetical protein
MAEMQSPSLKSRGSSHLRAPSKISDSNLRRPGHGLGAMFESLWFGLLASLHPLHHGRSPSESCGKTRRKQNIGLYSLEYALSYEARHGLDLYKKNGSRRKDATRRIVREMDLIMTEGKKSGDPAEYEKYVAATEEWLMRLVDSSSHHVQVDRLSPETKLSIKHRRRAVTQRYQQQYLDDIAGRKQWLQTQLNTLAQCEAGVRQLVDNMGAPVMEESAAGYRAVANFVRDHEVPPRWHWG